MKITALETIRIAEFVNLLWLKVHTSEGIVGLGETFFLPETVEAYVHENLAQKLLGRNPLEIDRISKDLVGYLGFRSTGAEMRGNSALDCPSSDDLRQFGCFQKGGSGSSVIDIKRHADDAANDDLRWSRV